jgi:hypothetical protein
MTAGSWSDAVAFELADVPLSTRLAERLARRRNVILSAERQDVMVVLAELGPEPEDLIGLLREVEGWVEEEAVCAIRFELDGRAYVLTAGEINWSPDALEAIKGHEEQHRARLLKALRSVDRALAEFEADGDRKLRIRGLEALRKDLVLAIRLIG